MTMTALSIERTLDVVWAALCRIWQDSQHLPFVFPSPLNKHSVNFHANVYQNLYSYYHHQKQCNFSQQLSNRASLKSRLEEILLTIAL